MNVHEDLTKRLGQQTMRYRVVEFDVNGDGGAPPRYQIALSVSPARISGGKIRRTGQGAPSMFRLGGVGRTTTDADEQRMGALFESPDSRRRFLAEAVLRVADLAFVLGGMSDDLARGLGAVDAEFASGRLTAKLPAVLAAIVALPIRRSGDRVHFEDSDRTDSALHALGRALGDVTDEPWSGWRAPLEDDAPGLLADDGEPRVERRRPLPPRTAHDEQKAWAKLAKWLAILIDGASCGVHAAPIGEGEQQARFGCGDLTMNDWHCAYWRDADDAPFLIRPEGEPVAQRTYTCLVRWRQTDDWLDFCDLKRRPGDGTERRRVEIRELRFDHTVAADDKRAVRLVLDGGRLEPVAHRIEFAVYGQRVVKPSTARPGEAQALDAIVDQFTDLRHILLLPNLNPDAGNARGRRFTDSRPRTLFSRQQTANVWLGEAALVADPNLRRLALLGPVKLPLGVTGATRALIDAALYDTGPDAYRHYRLHDRPLDSLAPGQYRWLEEPDGPVLEIYFKPNFYPCTMLAITKAGTLLSIAWSGPYSNDRAGWSIKGLARELADNWKVEAALLIDEGNDVFQVIAGADDQNLRITARRPRPSAMFVVTASG